MWLFKRTNQLSGVGDDNVACLDFDEFVGLVCLIGMQAWRRERGERERERERERESEREREGTRVNGGGRVDGGERRACRVGPVSGCGGAESARGCVYVFLCPSTSLPASAVLSSPLPLPPPLPRRVAPAQAQVRAHI